jgi:hypothetical protein
MGLEKKVIGERADQHLATCRADRKQRLMLLGRDA